MRAKKLFMREEGNDNNRVVAVYELNPPVQGNKYVLASAVDPHPLYPSEFAYPETLVFPSDEEGNVKDYGEIGGGRGYRDCDRAIREMGYSIEVQTPNGTPVFHGDHGLTQEHLELIDSALEAAESGFHIWEIDLPEGCPDLMSALYGPSAGDAPVAEDEVVYEKRGSRPGPSRLVDRPHRPVRRMIVVGIAGPDAKVFTAYGSQVAAPREWWDTSMKPHEAVEAAKFWSEHALAR